MHCVGCSCQGVPAGGYLPGGYLPRGAGGVPARGCTCLGVPAQLLPQEQCMLGDAGNKRSVCILLECILVNIFYIA